MKKKSAAIKGYIKKAAACTLPVFFILFLAACNSLAWFEVKGENEFFVDFGTMDIASRVYFDGEEPDSDINKPDEYGFYAVKVMPSEKALPDYLGNMRIDIYFKGIGANYIRVYITETWYRMEGENEIVLRSVFTNYEYESDLWIDNRRVATGQDGYYYYHDINSVAADKYEISYRPGESDEAYKTLKLVTGVSAATLEALYPREGTKLKVKVLTQAVQINRYREIWGIQKMPERA